MGFYSLFPYFLPDTTFFLEKDGSINPLYHTTMVQNTKKAATAPKKRKQNNEYLTKRNKCVKLKIEPFRREKPKNQF